MRASQRKTFRAILREEAPRNALRLETKARAASRLAKVESQHASSLYAIKRAAIQQLFRIPAYSPAIRDAWTTDRGFLLSVGLMGTGSLLHLPFDALSSETQESKGSWVSERARGRRWLPQAFDRVGLGAIRLRLQTSV